jgi:CMP-N-acetylneuraminic acid synthetase
MKHVLALIPARSGSKGIPHKNIAIVDGLPLLAHSIRHARAASSVTRVIVSTDSELYAAIARNHGAEVPFLRPPEYATDLATDLDVFQHSLDWLRDHENYVPDICVHLRPTCPVRDPSDIDRAVALLESDAAVDSVRTVVRAPETPYKMWFMDEAGFLKPILTCEGIAEAYNAPRQFLPAVYLQSANIDVVRTSTILQQHSMSGKRIRGLPMASFVDVDTPAQMQAAILAGATLRNRTFVFDLDGVLATITPDNDYDRAEPIVPNIEVVNRLRGMGNQIVIFTARGTKTGRDWSDTTRRQLAQWGVQYDHLLFGKPFADFYIDDRLISIHDLRSALA